MSKNIAYVGFTFSFHGMGLALRDSPYQLVHVHPWPNIASDPIVTDGIVDRLVGLIPVDVDGIIIHDEIDGSNLRGLAFYLADAYHMVRGKPVIIHCVDDYKSGAYPRSAYNLPEEEFLNLFHNVFPL